MCTCRSQTLVQWEDENREFLDYVKRTGGAANDGDLPSYVRMRIIEAADRNTLSNDERSSLLYWARVWLFAVLTLTALDGIPYIADQVRYSNARAGKSTTSATVDTPKHHAATDTLSAESGNSGGRSITEAQVTLAAPITSSSEL